VRVRFRYFPFDISRNWWIQLLEEATGEVFEIVEDEGEKVELSITGPYYGDIGDFKTPSGVRLKRLLKMQSTHGQQVILRDLATGVRPDKNARVNFWFTGENERPPFGEWNAYFGFDYHLEANNYAYLPLWFLTSTNLMQDNVNSYWGSQLQDIEGLLTRRPMELRASKFACAFVGKAYPLRLYALEALAKIGQVDIFGPVTRKSVNRPSEVAKEYKFTFCFENDVYPGYVTEKPLEAYLAGTVPIYFGDDPAGYLNQEAMLNLHTFSNISNWTDEIRRVNSDEDVYSEYFQKPILRKKPELDKVIQIIRAALS
jgi:hypothetical protein